MFSEKEKNMCFYNEVLFLQPNKNVYSNYLRSNNDNVDQSDKSKKYITHYSFKLKISLFKLNTLGNKKTFQIFSNLFFDCAIIFS